MKKQFTSSEKAAVVLEALKEQLTVSQISSAYQVHPTQIGLWKKQAKEGLSEIFSDKRKKENRTEEQMIGELYKLLGQRDAELSWLKKKLEPFGSP